MSRSFIPFIEAAGPVRTMCVGTFKPGDSYTKLAKVNGYLKGYNIQTFGTVHHVRLVETNGAPLVDVSARALQIMTGWASPLYVPVAIDDTAVGALPDMSDANPYSLQIIDASKGGRIVAEYWPLPARESMHGVPQSVIPPYAGTTAFLSQIRHCPPDYRTNFIMPRVGNSILYLALLFERPLLTGLLRYDLNELTDVSSEESHIVLLDRTLEDALPTLTVTRIALEQARPLPETVGWLIRDVAIVR